jgi:hypothetical protein
MFIQGEEDCIDKEEEEALGDRERFSLPVVNTNAEVNEQRHEQRATNGCKLQLLLPYIYRFLLTPMV